MNEGQRKFIIELINDSYVQETHFFKKHQQFQTSLLQPFLVDFEKLDETINNLIDKKYRHELHTYSTILSKTSANLSKVYRNLQQLKISFHNVRKCIEVVEKSEDLKGYIEKINLSLQDNDYDSASKLISEAIKCNKIYTPINPSTLPKNENLSKKKEEEDTKEKLTPDQVTINLLELEKIQNKVFGIIKKEFSKDNIELKELIMLTKMFSLINKKSEGCTLYVGHLQKVLLKDVMLAIKMNLSNCLVYKIRKKSPHGHSHRDKNSSSSETSYCTLLSSILDLIISVRDKNLKFISSNFGKEGIFMLIKALQSIGNDAIEKIIPVYIKKVEKEIESSRVQGKVYKNFNLVLDEVSVSHERLKLFLDFLLFESEDLRLKNQSLIQNQARIHLENLMINFVEWSNQFFKSCFEFFMKKKFEISSRENDQNLNPNEKIEENVIEETEVFIDSDIEDDDSSSSEEDEPNKVVEKVSPMIIDLFFIFQKSLERNFTDKQIICPMVNNINALIIEKIGKMYIYVGLKNIPLGKVTEPISEEIFGKIMISFNDYSQTIKFLKELKRKFESTKVFEILSDEDLVMVKLSLQNFLDTCNTFAKDLANKMEKMVKHHLEDKIYASLTGFSQKNYEFSESTFQNNKKKNMGQNSWTMKLMSEIRVMLIPYQKYLISSNFDQIVKLCITLLLDRIKDLVMKKKFHLFGGLEFEGEIIALQKFFSSMVHSTVIDKFTEINHIIALLRIMKSSKDHKLIIDDYFHLSEEEIEKIISLRTDLQVNDEKLKI